MTYLSQPYGARDAALWLLHNVAGPSRRHAGLTPSVPSGTIANAIQPALTLAFVGDVLPFRGAAFRVSGALHGFLASADVLVANLEGTIIEGRPPRVFMGQAHGATVIDFLASTFPPDRTVLTCANNHAPDYGWGAFERSRAMLAAHGFRTIGGVDAPATLVGGGVGVAAGTDWLNRPAGFVQGLDPAPPAPRGAVFRVLCPHWGHELESFPRPSQVRRTDRLLDGWDMIVGHHSHCPQPVTLRGGSEGGGEGRARRLVAYSLGNFTFGYDLRHHLHGLALKVSVGPRPDGSWAAGHIEWRRTAIRFARSAAVVELCR